MVLTGATTSLTLLAIILNIGKLLSLFLELICAVYPYSYIKSNVCDVMKVTTLKRKLDKTFKIVSCHIGMIL